jgi:hypothetical protein
VSDANVTAIPAPKPKKRKPSAREAETGDGYTVIEHRGVKLRVPVTFATMTVEAIDCFRSGDDYGGTVALLGEKQWAALKATGMLGGDVVGELGDKIQEALGKSRASANSSTSTATQ